MISNEKVNFIFSKLNLRPKTCLLEIGAWNSVADGEYSTIMDFEIITIGKTSYEDSNTGLEASSFPSKIGMLLCLTKLLSDLYGSGTGVQGPAPLALLPASHYE